MDEDWRNTFGILMCREICNGSGARICDGAPSTCSSFVYVELSYYNYEIYLDLAP